MKNLIIGSICNYQPKDVACWINSIRMNVPDVDVAIIDFGTPKETIQFLIDKGVAIYSAELNGRHIVVERFIAMYQLLDQKAEDYDHVISTDVKDVIFQNNPFEYLEDIYDDYTGEYIKICASSENIIYKNEDWGNNNLKVSYPHLYERFKNSEIFNAGVIGGETYFIKDLFLNIYHLSLIGGDRQPDQAAYNILIHSSPYDDIVHSTDIWCAQLGTSLADNIIEKYKDRTIDEHPPKIQDNGDVVFIQEVFSTNPTVFPIVHQWDRVSGLKEKIIEKFGNI